MFFRCVLLGLCLFHHVLPVSSCDDPMVDRCEDPPVFSPSHLVVRHGDPTSATCTACKDACRDKYSGLEKSLGTVSTNGSTITWTVDRMTEWDTSALCYYNYNNSKQCCTVLPVTVYHPPVRVQFRFANHSGPLVVNHTYIMECTVKDVAPVDRLVVSFHRGDTVLRQIDVQFKAKKPMTWVEVYPIIPSREDDGAQYWCQATLNLGPDGPEHPPVVESENITSVVHYEPYRDRPSHPDPVVVTNGYPFQLDCSAIGNPSPTYHWTLPASVSVPADFIGGDFTVDSATYAHGGQYTCTASNDIGLVTVTFNVQVEVNYVHIIIGVVFGLVAFAALICILVFIHYYKTNRTGTYKFPFGPRYKETSHLCEKTTGDNVG